MEITGNSEFDLCQRLQEIGLSAAVGIASFIPVTNAIFTGYSLWSSNKSYHQLLVMIQSLSDSLKAVEVSKDYLESDEFKALLYKTAHKVVADLREEKAKLFGGFLSGVAIHEPESSSDSYMMLEILDKLELEHIDFMQRLEPRTFSQSEENPGWTTSEEDLKILGIAGDRFSLLCDYLTSLGLVTRLEKFKVEESGHLMMWREYYLSSFGKKLVEVLRNPSTNECNQLDLVGENGRTPNLG